jgi:FixJ family two-component response regulator
MRPSLDCRFCARSRLVQLPNTSYIAHAKPDVPACLSLDVQLPDINGLELQTQISQENHPQIVFITGYGEIPASVRAIKAGAVDFLTKPFRQEDLLYVIHAATAHPTGSWIADHPNVKAYASTPGSRNSISNV